MTLPKISAEVMLATAEQATRQRKEVFAVESMMDGLQEQPELTATITTLIQNLTHGLDEVEVVPSEVVEAVVIETAMLVMGLTIKAFTAQVEADELNEAWG